MKILIPTAKEMNTDLPVSYTHLNCMDKMIEEYKSGSEIVYGVRDNRDTDSAFKRITAEGFYKVRCV